jgi:SAM-dependent methyltransferase
MENVRKPFQGVWNIIRFNWHFYTLATLAIVVLLIISAFLDLHFQYVTYFICIAIFVTTLLSLLASWYIYDLSGLYNFAWIQAENAKTFIVNVNAGFDETSAMLKTKFKLAHLEVFDFYNPAKHTEISIQRARKAYPPYPHTQSIQTDAFPLANEVADKVFVIFSAHEIRDTKERILFFKELARIVKLDGQIFITEHLRDLPNFLVYNLGFFHFYSKQSWLHIFRSAKLNIKQEIKLTPFLSTFVLEKDGNTF